MKAGDKYQVNLEWKNNHECIITSNVADSQIVVTAMPGSKQESQAEAMWSPEHLYLCAVNSNYAVSFFACAKNARLIFNSFSCSATCTIENIGGKLLVQDVILRPAIKILASKLLKKTLNVIEMSQINCVVFNSVKTRIHVFPDIMVEQ